MKRLLLSALAFSAGSLAFAQTAQNIERVADEGQSLFFDQKVKALEVGVSSAVRASSTPNAIAAQGDTLFAETFGNGLSGDGTNGSWTNSGTTAADWEYRGPSTNPDNTVGSRGAYAGTTGTIVSPTAANGFIIFDSDYLDNGGTPGAFGTGNSPTPHVGLLESPVIDLTNQTEVILQINTFWRRFEGDGFIVFSTDGGTTYPDSVRVFHEDTDATNTAGDNDEMFTAYVSNFIGGASQARIGFFFDGANSHGNTNGSGYYYWQLDDFYLFEAPDNDLVLQNTYINTPSDSGYQRYYTAMPKQFAGDDTLRFSGYIYNQGKASQPNTRLEVGVVTPTGAMITTASGSYTSTPGDLDSVFTTTDVRNMMGTGDFSFDFMAVSDSTDDVPGDNMASWDISYTDTVFARDHDDHGGLGYWYGAGQNYEIGTLFSVTRDDTATSISVTFQGSTAAGSIVSFHVYDGSLTTPVVSNTFYTLTAAEIGDWITVDIPDTYLPAGDYLVTYETFSDSVLWAVDADDPVADPQTTFVDPDNSGTWFWTTRVPLVRLNLAGVDCPSSMTGAITSSTDPSCGMANGDATVVGSGGTAPYFYTWPNGVTGAIGTGLAAGNYQVTIADNNNCATTLNVTLSNAGAPTVDTETVTDVTCNGDDDGTVSITTVGGSGNVTYVWSNGATGTSITGLPGGTYAVTFTDAGGCQGVAAYTVVEPDAMTGNGNATDATCFGDADGAVNVNVNGGTPGYSYSWTGPGGFTSTSQNISGVAAGTYDLEVSDANGCMENFSYDVEEPAELTATGSEVNFGDGQVSASGGTAPYTFSWEGGQTGSTVTGLNQGTYTVTATDANGCVTTTDVVIVIGVGFEELVQGGAVKAFPNPTEGNLNVEFTNAATGIYTIEVTNLVGQRIFSNEYTLNGSAIINLDLTEQVKGVYFLSITDADGNKGTQKVIVE